MPSIAFMSSGVSSKSNTWKEKRIIFTSLPRRQPPPGDWRTFQLDGDKKRGQDSHVCPQLPGEQAWDPLLSPHLSFLTFSFSLCLTNITVHQSLIFLRESLQTEKKCTLLSLDILASIPAPEQTLDCFTLPNTP